MTFFLYKPHVVGPKNNVTTPDIVIDRVSVLTGTDAYRVPVQRLSSRLEIQADGGELSVEPAYVLVAAGGGVLVSPGALVRGADHPKSTADLFVARTAWRLHNLIDHFASLELVTLSGPPGDAIKTGSASVADLAEPADIMERISGNNEALPRGIMVLCAAPKLACTVSAPARFTVQLADKQLGRSLSHHVDLMSVEYDRWEERPPPRYTVGPVGEVEHYI